MATSGSGGVMVLYEPSKPKKNPYINQHDIPFIIETLKKYGYIFKASKFLTKARNNE